MKIQVLPTRLILILFFVTHAWAQSTTSLHGVVTDPQGASLAGATIALSDPQTGFTRATNSSSDGAYQLLQIPPATYTVTASAKGFADFKQDNVRLLVGTPATLNFTLHIQGTNVTIEVSGEAPLVNTQDATIGNAFDTRQLTALPSEGRDPAAILSLQPGVTYLGGSKSIDQTNDSRGGSVSGARSDQTNITLDGLDNNDQLLGYAFQGALREPLDSLQEFRVVTTQGNADTGRSSGGQVQLVTKAGTNQIHGSVYEYNRPGFAANDWFNKQAEIKAGLPNQPAHLVRNTFGATFGGPIRKDRFFYFLAYEGERRRESDEVTQTVPSLELRQGIMQYVCDPSSDSNCIAGTPNTNGFTVVSDPRAGPGNLLVKLTPGQLAALDPNAAGNGTCPWANSIGQCGVDPNVLRIFNQYPAPNTDTVGDLLDYRGYTFPGAHPRKLNAYVAKLDYKLTQNGNHSLFLRGNLQNDSESLPPEFPRQPPSFFDTVNSKAFAAGYTAVISPTLINNFRWALVRQGTGQSGQNSQPFVHFRTLTDITALGAQSVYVDVPVHNFVDDLSWTKGKHTLQLGTNLRLVHNNRTGNMQNVSFAVTDPFSLDTNAGIANQGGSLDPSIGPGYPLVASSFQELYDFATMGVAGIVTVVNNSFNQTKQGTLITPGALIQRHFKAWEAEWYVQDAWRATPNLVLTAGLRYSLLQPPYETNGNQATPSISMGDFFAQRGEAMLRGQAYSPGQNAANGLAGGLPPITFGLSGQANGRKPYWNWDYKDLAPRFAIAYSPHAESGWLRSLLGSGGRSSIRAGYGLYFDHFGEGVVNTFDRNGSFGMTTTETNPYAVQDVDCADRFTSLFALPRGTYCGQNMNGVAPGSFPVTPPLGVQAPGGFAIYWGMDDRLRTPYSHVFDFSITRELPHKFSFEVAYVGRLGRHLLQETDLALPEDIVDPKTHMDYFTAATILSKLARKGTPVSNVTPAVAGMYWEDLFPAAQGPATSQLYGCSSIPYGNIGSTVTATQAMYDNFACNVGDEIVALQYADTPTFGACFPACSQLPGQAEPTPYNFFSPQFSSLWAWRTAGNSSYNALNVTLRHALSRGVQFDVNYTYSKSIDVGSNAERINLFDVNGTNVGGFSSQVINSWQPNQLRAVSDFDMKHQINSNWVVDLPVGRGQHFGPGMGSVANGILGGWSVTGVFHWSSGLPFSIFNGNGWPTNYNLTGQGVEIRNPGPVGVHIDSQGNPRMFADPSAALADFRQPYPGEGGQRNELRGPGFFDIDAGIDKQWHIKENQTLNFSWEVFNVTNAVRFDAALASNSFDLTSSTNFGVYNSTLTQPRVMQFMLRYMF